MAFLILLALLLVAVLAMLVSARRFEARERRLGKWDDNGPLVETDGPPERFRNAGMEERLEVAGEWDPPVTHDRRHEAPNGHGRTDDESHEKRG